MTSQECIFCKEELNNMNKSIEHIIPNCMGGKLKSNSIICRKCNNKFGTEFEETLIERFGFILHPIRLYNPNLKIKDIKVEKDGINYLLTKEGIKLKDPYQLNVIGGFTNMRFPSKASMKKTLKRMKIKDPTIDIQATVDKSEKKEVEVKDYVKIISKGINEKVYRCCGKICFEFLYNTIPDYKLSNDKFISFVMGELKSSEFPICIWYSNYFPLVVNEDSIYHLITIEGRQEERILIGYLNVFNFLQTLMILDLDYEGTDIIKGYYQDLVNNCKLEFEPMENLPLTREQIINLIDNNDPIDIQNEYEERFGYIMYKSRCLPIKKELEKLVSVLTSKIGSPYIDLLDVLDLTYYNLISILDKYGLYFLYKDQLETITEETDEITLLIKITIIIEILMTYFLKAKLSVNVFETLSHLICTY